MSDTISITESPSGKELSGNLEGQALVWNEETRTWEFGSPLITIPFSGFYRTSAATHTDPIFMGSFAHAPDVDEAVTEVPAPRDCTIKNFRLSLILGTVSVASFEAVLRVNGTNTTIAASVGVGQSNGADLAHRVDVLEGDLLTILVAGNGAVTPSNMFGRFELEYRSAPP